MKVLFIYGYCVRMRFIMQPPEIIYKQYAPICQPFVIHHSIIGLRYTSTSWKIWISRYLVDDFHSAFPRQAYFIINLCSLFSFFSSQWHCITHTVNKIGVPWNWPPTQVDMPSLRFIRFIFPKWNNETTTSHLAISFYWIRCNEIRPCTHNHRTHQIHVRSSFVQIGVWFFLHLRHTTLSDETKW